MPFSAKKKDGAGFAEKTRHFRRIDGASPLAGAGDKGSLASFSALESFVSCFVPIKRLCEFGSNADGRIAVRTRSVENSGRLDL